MAEPPARSTKLRGHHKQQPSHHKEQQNLSGSWFLPVRAAMKNQPTCCDWSDHIGSYIHHSMDWDPPKSYLEQKQRILKQPINGLQLGIVIANKSTSLNRNTWLGFKTIAVNTIPEW